MASNNRGRRRTNPAARKVAEAFAAAKGNPLVQAGLFQQPTRSSRGFGGGGGFGRNLPGLTDGVLPFRGTPRSGGTAIGRISGGGNPIIDLLGQIAKGRDALIESRKNRGVEGGYAKGWQPGYSTRGTNETAAIAKMLGGQPSGGDFISSLLAQAQGLVGAPPGELPFDAAEMAQKQFDPQYDLLGQLRTQATDRYNTAATDTQAMYDALAADIRKNAAATGERYGVAEQNLDAAFGGAAENIQSRASESNQEIAALMKQLGLQEAAPDAFANIEQERSRAINTAENLGGVYKGTNEALSQSMQDYQQNTANTTGIAGANASADIIQALGNILSGYDNKELELRGQQAAAENEYLMALQQMMGEQQSAYQGSVQDMMEMLMGQNRWEQEFGMDQARFGLDQQEAQWQRENQQAQREFDYAKWASDVEQATSGGTAAIQETLNAVATQMSPNPQVASNLVQGFYDALAMSRPSGPMADDWSFEELLSAIDRRFPNSPYRPVFQRMAEEYWRGLGRK